MKLIKPPEIIETYIAWQGWGQENPTFKKGDVKPWGTYFRGRGEISNCVIQFDEPFDPLSFDKIDVVIGEYKLFGMFPIFNFGDNKFECCVDFFEKTG